MKKAYIVLIIFFAIISTAGESEYGMSYARSQSWAELRLKEMTLREKIAQMITTYSDGFAIDENDKSFKRLKKLIEDEKVGGVIFFKGRTLEEARLINKIQGLSETPLLISQDFERGTAMRLEDGSLFPNNMGIGAARNAELAYKMGVQIAKECRAIGVHQNYSPVVDVNNNPKNPIINVRSFGEDPVLVSEMGDAMIRGLQDGGVIATAKHFPGHGDTDIDSHSDLPVINSDMERMNAIELVPFSSAIKAGVKSVMVAHVSFPTLDRTPYLPATLSPEIVDGLLINKLGFKGLIVTDALNMDGIKKHFSTEQVALKCVEAGIDIILMPQGEKKTIDAIEKAVKNGKISEERINESALKILEAKEWLKLNENKYTDENKVAEAVNNREAQNIAASIADESITLVKNDNVLPLKNSDAANNCRILTLYTGDKPENAEYFIEKMKEEYKEFTGTEINGSEISTGISSPQAILKNLINSNAEYIIIPLFIKVKMRTGTVGMDKSHADLIETLSEKGKRVIVISFGNPYLLANFPGVQAYIAAYGDSKSVIDAVIKTLPGKNNPKGKLPVTINENYKLGHGLGYK